MPKVSVLNQAGTSVGDIELNDAIFGIEPNLSYSNHWSNNALHCVKVTTK